jgi:3-hydroxypropanoate dehydrogenase
MNTVMIKEFETQLPIPAELLDLEGGHKFVRSLGATALATVFHDARTYSAWRDEPLDAGMLKAIYDLMKWAPTAANASPLRVTFVQSVEVKARLLEAVNPGNMEKVRTASATAILSYDTRFFEHMDKLAPHIPKPTRFETDSHAAEHSAERNAWLQAGYFIVAARSLGFDCGPVGGFDRKKVDAEFFADGRNRSILLVNIGYGKPESLRPRAARLEFDEACEIL